MAVPGVTIPGLTVPGVAVPGNMAGGKPLTAVAVGNGAVERMTPVLSLGTGKNVKQHAGEHVGWDSDRMKRYVVASRLVSTSTYRFPSTSCTSLGSCWTTSASWEQGGIDDSSIVMTSFPGSLNRSTEPNSPRKLSREKANPPSRRSTSMSSLCSSVGIVAFQSCDLRRRSTRMSTHVLIWVLPGPIELM
jgi:hypothetical protein